MDGMMLCACCNFFEFVVNTTAYYLGRYSLHLLLLKSCVPKGADSVALCVANLQFETVGNSWSLFHKSFSLLITQRNHNWDNSERSFMKQALGSFAIFCLFSTQLNGKSFN